MRPVILLAVAIALGTPLATDAQTTPWGDPDLQGVWTNQTPVPLERPAALKDKATFTPEEARALETNALGDLLKRVAPEIPLSGELNDVWLEADKGRVSTSRSTSMVVDPPDGTIPYTPEGRKRWDATPKLGPPLAADWVVDRAQPERCLITDGLFVPNAFYNNFHQIVQAPGHVVILSEMFHEARVIKLDRSPHAGAGVRMWQGDSRGWWEGRTLVVETTNFNDRRLFRGATGQMRLVERFTKLDADTVDYRLTITDPATFTRPWTIDNALRKGDGELYEVGCHEGNVGLRGILAGARAEEQANATK
jgi:hypothetical protein